LTEAVLRPWEGEQRMHPEEKQGETGIEENSTIHTYPDSLRDMDAKGRQRVKGSDDWRGGESRLH